MFQLLLSLTRGGGGLEETKLSHSWAGTPLRQEGVSILENFLPGLLVFFVQDTLVLPLLHHHQEGHRHTTEAHHPIGDTPFCSKGDDPFHLYGLHSKHMWEVLFVILSFSPRIPWALSAPPTVPVAPSPKVLRNLLSN